MEEIIPLFVLFALQIIAAYAAYKAGESNAAIKFLRAQGDFYGALTKLYRDLVDDKLSPTDGEFHNRLKEAVHMLYRPGKE